MKNKSAFAILLVVFTVRLSAGVDLLMYPKLPNLHAQYFNLNLVIIGASTGGSFSKTNELLASSFTEKNVFHFQGHTFLNYALYGEKRAFAILDSAAAKELTAEDILYIKTWVCRNSGNPGTEQFYYGQLAATYPSGTRQTFLDAQYYFEQESKLWHSENTEEGKQKLLEAFVKNAGSKTLSKSEQVLYRLMWLEVSDIPKNDSLLPARTVDSLWRQAGAYMLSEEVAAYLGNADAKKFAPTITAIETRLKGGDNFLKLVYEVINGAGDSEPERKKLEGNLSNIIRNERDSLKREQIKCLIKGVNAFSSRSIFSPVKSVYFSAAFDSYLKTKLSKKQLLYWIMPLTEKLGGKKVEITEEEIKAATAEDLSKAYGALLVSEIVMTSLEKGSGLFWASTFYTEKLNFEKELTNWNHLRKLLEENPFVEREYENMQEPAANQFHLRKGTDMVQSLINRYPGCVPLRLIKMQLVRIYFRATDESDTAFLVEYLKDMLAVMALQELKEGEKDWNETTELYYHFKSEEKLFDYYDHKDFLEEKPATLTTAQNKEVVMYFDSLCRAYPHNFQLRKFFYEYLGYITGYAEYQLKAYLQLAVDFPEEYIETIDEELDLIDKETISTEINKAIETINQSGKPVSLQRVIPLLRYLQEDDKAVNFYVMLLNGKNYDARQFDVFVNQLMGENIDGNKMLGYCNRLSAAKQKDETLLLYRSFWELQNGQEEACRKTLTELERIDRNLNTYYGEVTETEIILAQYKNHKSTISTKQWEAYKNEICRLYPSLKKLYAEFDCN